MEHVPTSPGIYVVTLTNEHRISVNADRPKIAARCISVNRDNCKYGRAVNLARRKADYQKTFGSEYVVFKVVAVTSNFEAIESEAGNRLGAFRIRGLTGKPNEWLQGISVSEVERILLEVIEEVDSTPPSARATSSAPIQSSGPTATSKAVVPGRSLNVEPKDVAVAARYLEHAGMSLEHLRDLHHAPARSETFAASIRYYSSVGTLRGKNQSYGARLVYVANQHQQKVGAFGALVRKALEQYPK